MRTPRPRRGRSSRELRNLLREANRLIVNGQLSEAAAAFAEWAEIPREALKEVSRDTSAQRPRRTAKPMSTTLDWWMEMADLWLHYGLITLAEFSFAQARRTALEEPRIEDADLYRLTRIAKSLRMPPGAAERRRAVSSERGAIKAQRIARLLETRLEARRGMASSQSQADADFQRMFSQNSSASRWAVFRAARSASRNALAYRAFFAASAWIPAQEVLTHGANELWDLAEAARSVDDPITGYCAHYLLGVHYRDQIGRTKITESAEFCDRSKFSDQDLLSAPPWELLLPRSDELESWLAAKNVQARRHRLVARAQVGASRETTRRQLAAHAARDGWSRFGGAYEILASGTQARFVPVSNCPASEPAPRWASSRRSHHRVVPEIARPSTRLPAKKRSLSFGFSRPNLEIATVDLTSYGAVLLLDVPDATRLLGSLATTLAQQESQPLWLRMNREPLSDYRASQCTRIVEAAGATALGEAMRHHLNEDSRLQRTTMKWLTSVGAIPRHPAVHACIARALEGEGELHPWTLNLGDGSTSFAKIAVQLLHEKGHTRWHGPQGLRVAAAAARSLTSVSELVHGTLRLEIENEDGHLFGPDCRPITVSLGESSTIPGLSANLLLSYFESRIAAKAGESDDDFEIIATARDSSGTPTSSSGRATNAGPQLREDEPLRADWRRDPTTDWTMIIQANLSEHAREFIELFDRPATNRLWSTSTRHARVEDLRRLIERCDVVVFGGSENEWNVSVRDAIGSDLSHPPASDRPQYGRATVLTRSEDSNKWRDECCLLV